MIRLVHSNIYIHATKDMRENKMVFETTWYTLVRGHAMGIV